MTDHVVGQAHAPKRTTKGGVHLLPLVCLSCQSDVYGAETNAVGEGPTYAAKPGSVRFPKDLDVVLDNMAAALSPTVEGIGRPRLQTSGPNKVRLHRAHQGTRFQTSLPRKKLVV